jgi:acetyl-CoA carboxylase biotin carboxyl carrier protein
MTIQEIKELLDLFNSSGVAEMEVQRGENRVRLRRAGTDVVVTPPAALPPVAAPTPEPLPAGPPSAPAAEETTVTVKSPIVGTFYESPSPDAAPFVKVGDVVAPGQVLCIIESMKLMNEIEAEAGGTIVARLVENGRPVEFGQPLFTVKPR